MSDRKLFYAYDKEGKKFLIDDIKIEERELDFYCPYCKERVVPKMGEQKVWHFSHHGEPCKFLKKKDKTDIKDLDKFSSKKVDIDHFKISKGDEKKYCCRLCKSTGNKEFAVKLSENNWICKECYMNADKETINKMM